MFNSSDVDTETETIDSNQSAETLDIKEEESDDDDFEEINEYEPETGDEAERPPQVLSSHVSDYTCKISRLIKIDKKGWLELKFWHLSTLIIFKKYNFLLMISVFKCFIPELCDISRFILF